MLAGKFSRDLNAVRLNFRNAQARQARHFSWVRSNDNGPAAAIELVDRSFKCVQTVRIHHYELALARHDCAHELGCLRITRDTWTNRERLVFKYCIQS